jgi:two-component system chemotaxis sensor kinase CheA
MTGGEFFEQFIDDYHAECDEHLATARRALLTLEAEAPAPPDPKLLRELFRSLHTLKGLSGMVGDVCAERVAHALEDSLRSADRAGMPLAPRFVDAFFAGVDLLERCIAARRSGNDEVNPEPVLDRLVASLQGEPDASVPDAASATKTPVFAPTGTDEVVYHFEFEPSGALAARGIGVDATRARLAAFGTILDARPRMVGSSLVFDFWVAVPGNSEPGEAWTEDGLRWTRTPGSAAPSPVAPTAASPESSAPALASSVARVELARLDAVMRLVGDLVVSRSRLDDLLNESGDLAAIRDALNETSDAMERQIRQLRESVMRIRLVPIGEVFERLRFAARDAIRESGKQVVLAFHGQETELDKLVVDRMLEPLLHLVRNAVSHGIERPEERLAQGKPAQGTLSLRATTAGDRICVDVEDDGAGIDVEQVARRARAHGLLAPDEPLDADRLLEVLCAPGFSTRDDADMTSGRGVGMDVVAATIRTLAGNLAVDTAKGRGTRFTIELPLTLMILDALLVEIGAQLMAVPQPALREILQVDASTIVSFENNEVISYRDGVLPLVSLSRVFGLSLPRPASVYVLVVGTDAAPMGLVVDRLKGLREIVVHPVNDPLVARPGVGGATELGDGRVSLILDTAALLRMAHEQRERRRVTNAALRAPALAS